MQIAQYAVIVTRTAGALSGSMMTMHDQMKGTPKRFIGPYDRVGFIAVQGYVISTRSQITIRLWLCPYPDLFLEECTQTGLV